MLSAKIRVKNKGINKTRIFGKDNKLLGIVKEDCDTEIPPEYLILERRSCFGLKCCEYLFPKKLIKTCKGSHFVAGITLDTLKKAPQFKDQNWNMLSKLEYFNTLDNYYPL